jgi:hypothetical protein
MADIEERRDAAYAAWLAELDANVTSDFYFDESIPETAFKAGYMAGVAQAQADYSDHYARKEPS